jgi:hypothetical protein
LGGVRGAEKRMETEPSAVAAGRSVQSAGFRLYIVDMETS